MSNYLAIATVTAVLQRTLQAAIQADVDGARVTTVKPNNLGSGTPEMGVNLYLYQMALNPVRRSNADVRNRNRKGEIAKRSQSAIDLHYLISCYGNESNLEPQRLLGSVIRTMIDRSTLTTEMIQDTITDSNFPYLIDSNLTDQVEEINFLPMDVSLEDLSKVWSVFFQTPYSLSIAYRATVVMIEGQESGQKSLPVRDRRVGIGTFFSQPAIDQVVSQGGKFKPILAESTLLIQGKNLKSGVVLVRIGEVEVAPAEVSDTQIVLPLSLLPKDALYAGVQSLQVMHQLSTSLYVPSNNGGGKTRLGQPMATQSALRRNVVESNVAPFVLCPTITETTVSNLRGSGDEPYSADVTVQVDLKVGKRQRVVLALNEWSINNPTAYLFDASPRRADSHLITVPIENIKPGEYLLRLQVDGAESQLKMDTDENSPTFNWYIGPKVLIAQGLA